MPSADTATRPTVVSAAAGRMRLHANGFRHDATRAAVIEETVAKVAGVRAVQAFPRTASVVIWYAPECNTADVLSAIASAETVPTPSKGADTAREPVARVRGNVVSPIVGGLVRKLANPRGDAADAPQIARLRAALERIGYDLAPAPSLLPDRRDNRGALSVQSRRMWLGLPVGLIVIGFTGLGIRSVIRWTAVVGPHAQRSRRIRLRRPTSPLAAIATSALAVPSWGGVAVALLLVTAAGAIAYRQRLGLTREIVTAGARAAVQLVTAGALLRILFQRGSLLGAGGWTLAMVIVAGQVAGRRAAGLPQARLAATSGVAGSSAITLLTLLAGRVIAAEARVIVPVGGMIISSAMLAAGSALRRLDDEVRRSRPAIEARLSLGQSGRQAILPHHRSALRAALIPAIDSTKVVGLISLPGAMTGLILAGISPLTAIRYHIVVMYMQMSATALASLIAVRVAEESLFDDAQRLVIPTTAVEGVHETPGDHD